MTFEISAVGQGQTPTQTGTDVPSVPGRSQDAQQFERSEPFERSGTAYRSRCIPLLDELDNLRGKETRAETPRTPRNAHDTAEDETVGSVGDPEPAGRIEIDLVNGYDPYELVPRMWTRLASVNRPRRLFVTDVGDPVRIEIVDDQPRSIDLSVDRLTQEVHGVAKFVITNKGRTRHQPCPSQLVHGMRAMPFDAIPLPRLRQVATAPLVADATGRIVSDNGYHEDLGIYLWCATAVPPVPATPTDEEVKRALAILREPLQDFPFVNDPSRATAMAVMITPFVRRLIQGPTPLHLIEKATPGTGATLLVDVLLTPAVGKGIQHLSAPESEHEWEYSLGAVLRPLPSAVVIDNARKLTSPHLAKALTDDVMVARLVGSSTVAAIPVSCVWAATANNPTLHQETARRTVRCCLDAGVPQPWLRDKFTIPNLKEWLHEQRTKMIWAVLTIIRGWFLAGQPQGERTLGMFESYSQVVGGILGHAGFKGFLHPDALVEAEAEDLQTEAERWLVTQWWARFKIETVHAHQLVPVIAQPDSPILELWGPETRKDTHGMRLGQLIRSIKGKTLVAGATATGGPGATVRVLRMSEDPYSRTARYRLQVVERLVTVEGINKAK